MFHSEFMPLLYTSSLTKLVTTFLAICLLGTTLIPQNLQAQENTDPYAILAEESMSDINAVIIQYSQVKIDLINTVRALTPSETTATILRDLNNINTRGLTQAENEALSLSINNGNDANVKADNWNIATARVERMQLDLSKAHAELVALLN
mgnify:CR=1 FL=1